MLQVLKKILFWTYPRGSWQYDILCLLILCFIFLTPRAVFDGTAFLDDKAPSTLEETDEPVQARASLPVESPANQTSESPDGEDAGTESSESMRSPD